MAGFGKEMHSQQMIQVYNIALLNNNCGIKKQHNLVTQNKKTNLWK